MSHAQRIARNSVFQGAAFAAQGLTEFIVALVLARVAGPGPLGEYTTLIILAGLFAFIASFGLPSLLTREIACRRDDREYIVQVVSAATGLVIGLSAVAFVLMIGVGVAAQYSPMLMRALALTAAALVFESLAYVVASAFRGVEALDQSAAISVVTEGSFITLALAVMLLDMRIDLLMGAYMLSRIFTLAVATWFFQRRFGGLRAAIDLPQWRMLLGKGLPFSINSVFSFAYSRIDIVILSYLASNVAVGFYEVAYGLSMRMNIVARAVTLALYPFLSFQFVRDKQAMRASAGKGIHFLLIPGFLIATILWVFGDEIVTLLYGASFAVATFGALRILALAVPLRFVETSLAVALDASNRAGRRAMAVMIAALANVSLNFALVPAYGMMGSVYATLLTELVILGVLLWFLRDDLREMLTWRAFFAPALGAAIILSQPLLFTLANSWLAMFVSVVLYGLTILAMDRSSIEPLRQLVIKRSL